MNTLILWLHLIGVVWWGGGILVNVLALMPSMNVLSPPERGKFMGAFMGRFANLTWGSVILVVITGLLMIAKTIGFSALFSFDNSYTNILLVKIVLVAVLIFNGSYLSFTLGPKMAPHGPPAAAGPDAGPPPEPSPESLKLQKTFNTLLRVQVALVIIVIYLAAS